MSSFSAIWSKLKRQQPKVSKRILPAIRGVPAYAQIAAGAASQTGLGAKRRRRRRLRGRGKVISGLNEIIARQAARKL